MTRVVAGIDAGATRTRCAVVDDTGRLLGAGDAAGANRNSSADPAATLRAAFGAAVAGTGAARVDVLVLGAAGAGAAGRAPAEALMRAAVDGVDVGRFVVHSDIEVAFAAGSPDPDGTVVIAGTGAVAARIVGFAIDRRIDGYGYLLGDRGSAVWLGVRALRAALATLDGTGPATVLGELVLDAVDTPGLSGAQAVVAATYGGSPAEIGRFAIMVERAAAGDDDVARRIVDDAVDALLATARATGGSAPVVVAGAVATGSGSVGARLRHRLGETFGAEPLVVTDTRRGAVALALRALPDPPLDLASRLVTEGLG